jgi:hypothetical protein
VAALDAGRKQQRASARGAVRAGRRLLAGVLACAAAALGGCGGSSSTVTAADRAHALALAGAACLEYNRFLENLQAHEGAGSPSAELEQFLTRTEERGNKVRVALTPLDKQPGVATYISDLTTQVESEEALARELKKSAAAYLKLTETKPFAEKTRHAGAAVAADAKALGLSACVGPKPRKAVKG